jgi:phage minor structural protein
MIPTLYAKAETDFTHNGIGFLVDAVKCTVTEERNGSYELSLRYPITGRWYDQITYGAIIKAKANETSEPQLFRIYKISKPLDGIVTYSAEHISYDLNGIPIFSFSVKNVTPQTAINQAFNNAILPCPFTVWSDISTLNSSEIKKPCSVRAILGGQTSSVLDVWGGEYEFDNFSVKLHAHRGQNNGVTIEYGKNLKDLKQDGNITDCYTHLCPYAVHTEQDDDGNSREVYLYLSEKVLALPNAAAIGHSKAYIMDFSNRFAEGEEFTEAALRAKATAYAAASDLGIPKVNITVSFVQLWQTEEYKNIAPLERVKMCDTVTVRFSKLGVTATAKVIKTVYDSLAEKYESVEIGDAKSSFADTVNKQTTEISNIAQSVLTGRAKTTEEIKKAILVATNLITGQSGGYVVLNPAEKPQEILILDAPTIEEAVKVWRWNSGGLGYSSTGYNGEYALAMTMDGAINADFIRVGELNGNIIKANTIQADAISAETFRIIFNTVSDYILFENGKIKAIDSNDKVRATLGQDGLKIFKGSIAIYKGDNEYSTPALMVDDSGNMALDGYLTRYGSPITMSVGYDQNYYHGIFCYAKYDYYKRNDGTYAPFIELWSSTGNPKTSMLVGVTKLGFAVKDTDPDSHSVYSRLHITANGGELLGQWQFAQEQNFSSNIGANSFKLFDGDTHIASFYHSTSDNPCLFSNNGNPLLIGVNGNTAITARSNGGTLCGAWNFTQDQYFTYSIYGWNIGVYRNGVLKSQLYNSDSGVNAWASMDGSDLRLVIKSGDNWNARLAATTKGGDLWGEWTISTDSGYVSLVTDKTGNGGGHLWGTWYLGSSTPISSDRSKKNNIENLSNKYSALFDELRPVRYKYNDGTSGRYHTGFIAQEVETALIKSEIDTLEFAGLVKTDKNEYFLRYEEFIALAINEIQHLKKKNVELETKFNSIIENKEL